LRPVRGVEEKHEAPTNKDLAQAQVVTAHACSKTGDFECALKGYQKAYEYQPNPLLLFNIAQMRRKMGNFAEASRGYQAFLKDPPAGQDKLKDEATKQLAFCDLKMKGGSANTAVALATTTGQRVPAGATPQQDEEDTDPPILTHEPVKKTLRGQPI